MDDEKNYKQTAIVNKFANDGSFLELFKSMQQQKLNVVKSAISDLDVNNEKSVETELSRIDVKGMKDFERNSSSTSTNIKLKTELTSNNESTTSTPSTVTSSSTIVNKRRCKILKVGTIKRTRPLTEEDEKDCEDKKGDAWQQYMKQVRQYKEKFGDDSDKNRPLVK